MKPARMTVHRLVKAGKLKAIRRRGQLLVPVTAIMQYLEERLGRPSGLWFDG